jgi:hypothetical protein
MYLMLLKSVLRFRCCTTMVDRRRNEKDFRCRASDQLGVAPDRTRHDDVTAPAAAPHAITDTADVKTRHRDQLTSRSVHSFHSMSSFAGNRCRSKKQQCCS